MINCNLSSAWLRKCQIFIVNGSRRWRAPFTLIPLESRFTDPKQRHKVGIEGLSSMARYERHRLARHRFVKLLRGPTCVSLGLAWTGCPGIEGTSYAVQARGL